MADSVDKAFEDLSVLKMCLKRIHRFSPGVPGENMRKDMGKCIQMGHWNLILSGVVDKKSIRPIHLHTVCRLGRTDIVEALIVQYDQNPYAMLRCSWTTLHTAVLHYQKEVVQTLLRLGVVDTYTDDGILAFDIRPNFYEMKRPLMPKAISDWLCCYQLKTNDAHGREMVPLTTLCASICEAMDEFGPLDIWDLQINKQSPLDIAISRGSMTLCHILLGRIQEQPLEQSVKRVYIMALFCAEHEGHFGMIQFLLEYGLFWEPSIVLESFVLRACQSRNARLLRLLLEYGASPNPTGYQEIIDTPLHAAYRMIAEECASLLLQYGADPHLRGNGRFSSKSVLEIARERNDVNFIRFVEERLDVRRNAKRRRHV